MVTVTVTCCVTRGEVLMWTNGSVMKAFTRNVAVPTASETSTGSVTTSLLAAT